MEYIRDLIETNSYFSLAFINDNEISYKTKFFALSDLDHAYEIKKLVKTKYPELKVTLLIDFNEVMINIKKHDC